MDKYPFVGNEADEAFRSNETIRQKFDINRLMEDMRRAKGADDAFNNVDYRIQDITFPNEIQQYVAPDYNVNGKPFSAAIEAKISANQNDKNIQKSYFVPDIDHIYQTKDGDLAVRGLRYWTSSTTTNYEKNTVYYDVVEVRLTVVNSISQMVYWETDELETNVKATSVPAVVQEVLNK